MVSNQIVQNVLIEIATITDVSAAVYGSDGACIAVRGDMSGIDEREVAAFILNGDTAGDNGGFYINRICQEGETELVSVVKKGYDNSLMAARLIVIQMEGLLLAYKEKMDKDSFIKNLLLDNLLQIDIFNRSRRLHIEFKEPRVVFIVKGSGNEQLPIHEILKIVVHTVSAGKNRENELKAYAENMMKAINEAGLEADIAYGSIVEELKDVSKSYKEARLAHDVRSIFYEDRKIISFTNLGIGRLIYQLPLNLCRMFIKEIFGGRTLDEFDDETLTTINKFFENNLNVSETSRQLFIHRNTLVYRLDKLQKQTGLDIRIFEDAITFKIALMVVKYIDYMDRIDY